MRAVSDFRRDLRFAVRSLARSPGFTAVALATLAFGIGANTAIFSVVNGVLLRPLPFPEPDRLVAVYQTFPRENVATAGMSYPNYADLAAAARSFETLGAIRMHDYTLTGRGEPMLAVAGTVTSNVFAVFRATPLLGRALSPADDAAGAPAVAVLSEKLWRERFGGDPRVLGEAVMLDARPFTIVGVLPAAFRTPPENPPAELWTPLPQDPVFRDLAERRGGHYLTIVGRLAAGAVLPSASAEAGAIQARLARQFPKENEGWGVRLVPLAEGLVAGVRTALWILLGAVGLVFLIACANVANLLLVRSAARSREVAVRTALGAARGRLVRLFLTESLVLGGAGGALGIALAAAGMGALRGWLPADLPRAADVGLDWRVLAFSVAVSMLSAAIFGLAPALQASRSNLAAGLREGAPSSGESGGKKRLRDFLIVGETALSFVLLVGAGLLARSFLRLQAVRLGFEPEHVLTAGLSLPRAQYSKPDQWIGFYTRLVERLEALPGVSGAAAALPLPLEGGGLHFEFKIEGRAPAATSLDYSANYTAVTPGYFSVLRVPLLRGRLFAESDAASAPKVCLVSETFAKRYFPGEDPLGHRLVFGFTESAPREIVGVLGDVRRDGLSAPSRPEMYVPFVQDPWWATYLALRAPGDPGALAAAVRREVAAIDPTLPIEGVQPMTQVVYDSIAQPRFRTRLVGVFGTAALLLAVLGIYGVMSYAVGRRAREMGIRVALGAGRADVLRLVLRQGLGLTALGLAAGALGAAAATRFVGSVLYDVGPLDPATYAAVALLLVAAGLVACFLPAWRATRVDPVRALRES